MTNNRDDNCIYRMDSAIIATIDAIDNIPGGSVDNFIFNSILYDKSNRDDNCSCDGTDLDINTLDAINNNTLIIVLVIITIGVIHKNADYAITIANVASNDCSTTCIVHAAIIRIFDDATSHIIVVDVAFQ